MHVGFRILFAAAALTLCAALEATPRLLGIEHVPVAIRDLDAASTRFRALGFTLKPGRFHANAIRNVHAKFADGSYIELIAAPEARDALTRHYRAFLADGEGPAFASLYVDHLSGLTQALDGLGAREEEGTATFSGAALAPFFFGTRDRSPTDLPIHYRHANGAQGLERIWIASRDRQTIERMAMRLGAPFRPMRVCLPDCRQAHVARLPHGELVLLDSSAQRVAGHPLLGLTVRVDDLQRVRTVLNGAGLHIGRDGIVARGHSLFVPPALANGLWLEFREAQAVASSGASSP